MYMYDKWIWIQYTPGAAGKLLCAVIQLSQNVDSWLPGLDNDYKNFVNNRILIKSNSHLKHEIMWPYNIDFYTRKLPFTRGDDLTSDQAEKIFKEKNKAIKKYIVTPWTKPYIVDWFKGKIVAIINDKESINFLKNRRDTIFYEWQGNTVSYKALLRKYCPKERIHLLGKFKDDPLVEKVFKNKEDFYQDEFYNNPTVKGLTQNQTDNRVVLNVPLSSLWLGSLDELIQNLNEQLKIKIPTEKAKWLINSWVEHNKKFL